MFKKLLLRNSLKTLPKNLSFLYSQDIYGQVK
jgi:hypothetical protein